MTPRRDRDHRVLRETVALTTAAHRPELTTTGDRANDYPTTTNLQRSIRRADEDSQRHHPAQDAEAKSGSKPTVNDGDLPPIPWVLRASLQMPGNRPTL